MAQTSTHSLTDAVAKQSFYRTDPEITAHDDSSTTLTGTATGQVSQIDRCRLDRVSDFDLSAETGGCDLPSVHMPLLSSTTVVNFTSTTHHDRQLRNRHSIIFPPPLAWQHPGLFAFVEHMTGLFILCLLYLRVIPAKSVQCKPCPRLIHSAP